MIEILMAHPDLARVRFAHSPIQELVASLNVIGNPGRRQMYHSWLSDVVGQLDGLRVDRLVALAKTGRDSASFIRPSPTQAWGNITDELAAVAATPSTVVRTEIEAQYRGRQIPTLLRFLYDDPSTHLPTVVGDMAKYWHIAIEPMWQRLQALCVADVCYRAEQFASGGVAHVLSALHPSTSFTDDRLLVGHSSQNRHYSSLGDRGLVLVPCAFSWPRLTVRIPPTSASANGSGGQQQPSLIYPPRGVATLWQARTKEPAPLTALVGRTRAALLASLGLPASTTQLAEQLNLSAAAISQHLKILKESGLAAAHRRGRIVFYQRTEAGTVLLSATQVR
jgi:Helix-turn-helix domain/Family of unknown function (DUF5937)